MLENDQQINAIYLGVTVKLLNVFCECHSCNVTLKNAIYLAVTDKQLNVFRECHSCNVTYSLHVIL